MQPAALIDAIILAGFFIEGDRKAYRVSARVCHGSPFSDFQKRNRKRPAITSRQAIGG
jgi:hypothetical protein